MGKETFRVAAADRVEYLLDRLVERVLAEIGTAFRLVGIRRRGVPLAQMLADRAREHTGREFAVGELNLKRYSDDLVLLHREPKLQEENALDVDGGTVLLVDDVLYSGWTLFRAAGCVVAAGAERVHCAVLCARGPEEVPVKADFVGLRLDVGPHGIVEVEVPPYERELGVVLRRKPEGAA